MTLTYYITDVYDWGKDNSKKILFISPKELYQLKLIRNALEFEIRGYITITFEWNKGERLGKGLL